MKTVTKVLLVAVAVLIVVLLLSLAGKIVSGTFHLLESAFGTVLGVILILALLAIVLWMFLYAKKARKEKEAAKQAEASAAPVKAQTNGEQPVPSQGTAGKSSAESPAAPGSGAPEASGSRSGS